VLTALACATLVTGATRNRLLPETASKLDRGHRCCRSETLTNAHLYVESEIFKYRTRTGDYSAMMASGRRVVHKSMSLKYEPSSEPLHISAK